MHGDGPDSSGSPSSRPQPRHDPHPRPSEADAATTERLPERACEVVHSQESTASEADHDDAHLLKDVLAGTGNRILGDRYQVRREVGRGGMGVVFAGWDTQLEREVAIKVLAISPQRPGRTLRFLREARIASRLKPSRNHGRS